MKILITGDLVISRKYSISNINDDIKKLFSSSDYNVVNLEAPVTESTNTITKTGPHLKSNKESTLGVVKGLKINMVTLANNHILDYGAKGVLDTLAFCKENNIHYVGAGENKEKASMTHYLNTPEMKIAFLNVAENEWSSATEKSPGGNGMDLIDDTNAIKEAKSRADYVFVIVHGGHEYYNLPSPRMQRQYRFYIDNGADIVVAHHPHCLSGSETYKGKPIFYSLGNFLFTKENRNNAWYQGAVLEINLTKDFVSTNLHFVQQLRESFELKKTDHHETITESISALNTIIADPQKLDARWEEFVAKKSKLFTSYWSLFSIFGNKMKALFLRLGISGLSKEKAVLFYNLIRCEAHRDITLHFLKNKIDK